MRKTTAKVSKPKVVYATDRNFRDLEKLPRGTIVRAYKYVDSDFLPVIYPNVRPQLRYLPGHTVIERNYDSDPHTDCGAGLNVATKRWCVEDVPVKRWYKLILVEFRVSNIVCIPINSNGKFRVKRLKVLKQVRWR